MHFAVLVDNNLGLNVFIHSLQNEHSPQGKKCFWSKILLIFSEQSLTIKTNAYSYSP